MSTSGGSALIAAALAAVRRRGQDAPGGRDLKILTDAVEDVLAIHRPSRLTVGGYVCGKCLDPYPCTTVRALERRLKAVD